MSNKRVRACGDDTWNDADSAGEFYKSRAYGTVHYCLSMAEVTGRRPALAQERIWSSVCSTAVSEWDCREMYGMSMVYSQPRSPNLLVTAVAVEKLGAERRGSCWQSAPNVGERYTSSLRCDGENLASEIELERMIAAS
jgi:hypothetical protein